MKSKLLQQFAAVRAQIGLPRTAIATGSVHTLHGDLPQALAIAIILSGIYRRRLALLALQLSRVGCYATSPTFTEWKAEFYRFTTTNVVKAPDCDVRMRQVDYIPVTNLPEWQNLGVSWGNFHTFSGTLITPWKLLIQISNTSRHFDHLVSLSIPFIATMIWFLGNGTV